MGVLIMIMNKFKFIVILLLLSFSFAYTIHNFDYPNTRADYELKDYSTSGISLHFLIETPQLSKDNLDGETIHSLMTPNDFLPAEDVPALPTISRIVALPQGAKAELRITDYQIETMENIYLEFEPKVTSGSNNSTSAYSHNATGFPRNGFYPQNPFTLSEQTSIRGMDIVKISIAPYQYNPVSKELIIYRDLKLEIDFVGGSNHFGDDRLRSKWFDPIIFDLVINPQQIPPLDYSANNTRQDGYEYIIIVPDDPDFISWGDTIRIFRIMQGIRTKVVTTTEIGGNDPDMIKDYISDAYDNWDIPPVAVLLLADHGSSGNTVTSQIRTDHPFHATDEYASDHYYSDMSDNHLPDIIISRIAARDGDELETMVNKFIDYETNPPTNPHYYNHPISSMKFINQGLSTLLPETINGFWENELGKEPDRQYSGLQPMFMNWTTQYPDLVALFGPDGLGYIPETPDFLNYLPWDANASTLNNAINNGAFMYLYHSNGAIDKWLAPHYEISDLDYLMNEDLIFVFSLSDLTGKFDTYQECLVEAMHRHEYGALGVIAPSDVIFSYVTEVYTWGIFNNLWAQFLPEHPTTPPSRNVLPAFGNAGGKYFLYQFDLTLNPQHKQITYYLFHHFGDAFSTVYTEMPQTLTVEHDSVIIAGENTFNLQANEGALISLSVDGEIIATTLATGNYQDVSIEPQEEGTTVDLVVTKQNYYRYHQPIQVHPPIDAEDDPVLQNYLSTNYPNPFNPSTTISYSLAENINNPKIEIYNLKGQLVRELELPEEQGIKSITWDGKNMQGRPVASGVYLYRLVNDSRAVASRKMLLLK
jgi:hypothetical protein